MAVTPPKRPSPNMAISVVDITRGVANEGVLGCLALAALALAGPKLHLSLLSLIFFCC